APSPASAAGVDVSAVRYWTAPDHTRIVIDLTDEASYSTRVLTGPDRVVVLIVGGGIGDAQVATPVGDGLVDRVRLNQLQSGAQVVVDLPAASAHTVFPLKPYLNKPNRIVIDVFHEDQQVVVPAQRPERAEESKPRVVIIDPGHGGEDPGTLGNGVLVEKDIVLDVSTRLAALLNSRGGYDVHLTRDGDYFVRLAKRKEIANVRDGDVFISIHANSAPNRRADGTEIFYVSPRGATDQAARELADRENAADLVGGVSPDADEDVLSILVDLKMSDSVQKSSDLAGLVEDEIGKDKLGDCAIKQAGFLVLKSLAMPSILVEVGFLTNSSDVDKLKRPSYRQSYAECLAAAIDRYFDRYAPVVAAHVGTHKVAPGETLWTIARRYDITVDDLRSLNGLDRGATIQVDQVLSVTGS
ncbi:MAG: N-acetylmuramoyl-L-alanine amidase, partial [Candidatus Eisenbacteria bacterium]|nr:N-acetylmuramoyl-L-alanine amidase [Candidatus Eisenbacteria bacterium]